MSDVRTVKIKFSDLVFLEDNPRTIKKENLSRLAEREIMGGVGISDLYAGWPVDQPIVEAILPGGDFNAVTGALASVGLGDVPSWLRPFHALSNGQQFRAGLARLVTGAPECAVVDEFTSVVDRQIAKVGAMAFSKAWRKTRARKLCFCPAITTLWSGCNPIGCLTRGRVKVKKKRNRAKAKN